MFKELKDYLSTAPILSTSEDREDLFLYLVVSEVVVSVVLVRKENRKQKPVFYTSKMLLDAETRYNDLEKIVLALVTIKKKLRHYFESHSVMVVMNYPIRKIPSKPDLFERLTKWAIELGIYKIKYIPEQRKRSQGIADFLVEIQSFEPTEKELIVLPEEGMRWILNTDGASNK